MKPQDYRRDARTEYAKALLAKALHLVLSAFVWGLLFLEVCILVGAIEGSARGPVYMALTLGACGTANAILPLLKTLRAYAAAHKLAAAAYRLLAAEGKEVQP